MGVVIHLGSHIWVLVYAAVSSQLARLFRLHFSKTEGFIMFRCACYRLSTSVSNAKSPFA
jgi:hypothetical protein